jgi:hypothetical protein
VCLRRAPSSSEISERVRFSLSSLARSGRPQVRSVGRILHKEGSDNITKNSSNRAERSHSGRRRDRLPSGTSTAEHHNALRMDISWRGTSEAPPNELCDIGEAGPSALRFEPNDVETLNGAGCSVGSSNLSTIESPGAPKHCPRVSSHTCDNLRRFIMTESQMPFGLRT